MNRVQFLPSIKGISVIGSLNENKTCQDRVRVLDGGVCQSLRATDFKDPPKILLMVNNGK